MGTNFAAVAPDSKTAWRRSPPLIPHRLELSCWTATSEPDALARRAVASALARRAHNNIHGDAILVAGCLPAGAEPYKRELKTLEYHLLDAGHFALETEGDTIAGLMREFLGKHVKQ